MRSDLLWLEPRRSWRRLGVSILAFAIAGFSVGGAVRIVRAQDATPEKPHVVVKTVTPGDDKEVVIIEEARPQLVQVKDEKERKKLRDELNSLLKEREKLTARIQSLRGKLGESQIEVLRTLRRNTKDETAEDVLRSLQEGARVRVGKRLDGPEIEKAMEEAKRARAEAEVEIRKALGNEREQGDVLRQAEEALRQAQRALEEARRAQGKAGGADAEKRSPLSRKGDKKGERELRFFFNGKEFSPEDMKGFDLHSKDWQGMFDSKDGKFFMLNPKDFENFDFKFEGADGKNWPEFEKRMQEFSKRMRERIETRMREREKGAKERTKADKERSRERAEAEEERAKEKAKSDNPDPKPKPSDVDRQPETKSTSTEGPKKISIPVSPANADDIL